jgi:hypothetical protein
MLGYLILRNRLAPNQHIKISGAKMSKDFTYAEYHLTNKGMENVYSLLRQKRASGLIEAHKSKKILEIGIGANPVLCCLSRNSKIETLVSLEPNAFFATRYKKFMGELEYQAVIDLKLIESSLEDCDLNQLRNYFAGFPDFIVINSVIHEVPDLDIFFSSIKEMCDSHTLIHLNVPNGISLHKQLYDQLRDKEIDNKSALISGRIREFTPKSLQEIVSQYGFDVIELSTVGYKPFTMDQLSAMENCLEIDMPKMEDLAKITTSDDWGAEIEMLIRLNS